MKPTATEGTLTVQVSLPEPRDRVDLNPDNGLTYTGLLKVQLV
jgi:hypothetical protein